MRSVSITGRERQRLARVASDYEAQGYNVKLLPSADEMPEFLASFEPDLIAIGKDEFVVVEVKARKELENLQPVAVMEAAIRNQPGWRFELIIDGLDREQEPLLGMPQITTSIEEASQLQQSGHVVAALLLVWSTAEGILRLLATRENVELESAAPGYITTRLYTLGLLGREQYRILEEALQLRNQAAHGFQVSVTEQDVAKVTTVARQLLSELEAQAA
jgi:REase_AHJR-like protein